MKQIIKTVAILMLVITAISLPLRLEAQDKKKKGTQTETMKCWASMSCMNCVAKIEKNIPFEKGVTDLAVDLPTKTVTITYKPSKTNPKKLEKALQDLGYKTEILADKK
jgi:periplasmic mercuric ion binding protein